MKIPFIQRACLQALLAMAMILPQVAKAEVEVRIPDYFVSTFATLKTNIYDLSVDPDGRLYALTISGIYRFTKDKQPELWSTAVGFGLGFTQDGIGFLTTRSVGHSILRVAKDGTWRTLPTSLPEVRDWDYTAITSDGFLVAVGRVAGNPFQWMGEIDIQTGSASVVSSFDARGVEMGASPPGYVYSLLTGPAGAIYVAGSGKSSFGVYRAKRGDYGFKKVADLPTVVFYMAIDDRGVIYGASSEGESGTVLRIDPITGITDLLATGFNSVPSLAFDKKTQQLFAAEQGAPYTITAISIPPDACVPSPRAVIRTSEVEIAWPTQSNRVYRVEFREKLKTEDSWSTLFTNLLGQGTPLSVFDKVRAGQPERVYRILCETNVLTKLK